MSDGVAGIRIRQNDGEPVSWPKEPILPSLV